MTVNLRNAALADRRMIYDWLARSDATPEMLGPPTFSDAPVPDFAEFCADYDDDAFQDSGPFRLFVIAVDDREIGAISYYLREDIAEIDLWIGSASDWGRGYGPAAIRIAAEKLEQLGNVRQMIIRPSARNRRAVAGYRNAGFAPYDPGMHDVPGWCLSEGLDYSDAVLMVRPVKLVSESDGRRLRNEHALNLRQD